MDNRLFELRKQKKLSQNDLSKIFNVAQNTISQWENGTRNIDSSMLLKFATFFNTSIDYLLCNTDIDYKNTDSLSPSELDLIKKYRLLDENRQEAIRDLIETSYERAVKTQKNTEKLIS